MMQKIKSFMLILAGVLLFYVFQAKGFAATALIEPFGNLYLFFGYDQSKSFDISGKESNDKDTLYKINNNSNLGFNFKHEQYSGVFELGFEDHEKERAVKIRRALGKYKFSFGELMLGQDFNPYVKWSNELANFNRSEGFGALYEEPAAQVRFTSTLGLYLSIARPNIATEKYNRDQAVNNPIPSNTTFDEYKAVIVEREVTTKLPLESIKALVPKLNIGYKLDTKYVKLDLGAAMNSYSIEKTPDITFNKDKILSYLVYANLGVNYSIFLLNINGGYSVNPRNFGILSQSRGNDIYAGGGALRIENIATGKFEIKDTSNIQVFAEFGVNITKEIQLFLGYGYSLVDYPVENTEKDYAVEYYANINFSIGQFISLAPSFSYRDYKKDLSGKSEGSELFIGVLSVIAFE